MKINNACRIPCDAVSNLGVSSAGGFSLVDLQNPLSLYRGVLHIPDIS